MSGALNRQLRWGRPPAKNVSDLGITQITLEAPLSPPLMWVRVNTFPTLPFGQNSDQEKFERLLLKAKLAFSLSL